LIFGTVHTCVGQELCAVSVGIHLNPEVDAVFATHRGHGLYLAYGGRSIDLLAEMTGRSGALCLGRGGSQHLQFQNFFSNGIQGAGAVQAVGFAWGQKLKGNKGMTVAQIGDGTLGQGSVYEAFNFASILKAPVLFLLEYNGWAQSTDVKETISGSIEARAIAFGLKYARFSDRSPEELFKRMAKIADEVREGVPYLVVIDTQRLLAHSKGDDDRDPDLIARQIKQDPLNVWASEFPDAYEAIRGEVVEGYRVELSEIRQRKTIEDFGESPLPKLGIHIHSSHISASSVRSGEMKVLEALNSGLHGLFEEFGNTLMIGEDIKDPYGGAFKVTKGLSTRFSGRVFSTPIAENAIAGLSNGVALCGFRPLAEIMFADFATLAADQLINSAAKFYYMFGEKIFCPVFIRLVSGGGRGYGPTHSQCTEVIFCGIPGLRVLAMSEYHEIPSLLNLCFLHDRAPVIFVEDKMMYTRLVRRNPPMLMCERHTVGNDHAYPPIHFTPVDQEASLTIVCYGQGASIAEEAIGRLIMEEEIFVDFIVVTQIWPLDVSDILASVKNTKRLLVVDPNSGDYGFASTVVSMVLGEVGRRVFPTAVVGAMPFPNPASKELESKILPNPTRIFNEALQLSSQAVH
jgi:2-oxoisovalerate dehydrogenase E1 component